MDLGRHCCDESDRLKQVTQGSQAEGETRNVLAEKTWWGGLRGCPEGSSPFTGGEQKLHFPGCVSSESHHNPTEQVHHHPFLTAKEPIREVK